MAPPSDGTAAPQIAELGEIIETFDRQQDSGNVSWLVRTRDEVCFVKSAGRRQPPPEGPVPYLDFDGRVALLCNAAELARSCDHPALAQLRRVIETGYGPLLVYDRALGELVGTNRPDRLAPDSMYHRLAAAPAALRLAVLDQLLDAHVALAATGWVAVDLYDGCLMVDLESGRLTLIDLDTYHRGPTVNTMGRMFGSDRFMAPEEYQLGATIDQRTTVFTLGRLCWHFGTGLTEERDRFAGGPDLADVVTRAISPVRDDRFASVAAFAAAWRRARTT